MPRTIILVSSLLLVLLSYRGLTEAETFTPKRLSSATSNDIQIDEEVHVTGSGSGKVPYSDDEDFGESGSGSGSGLGDMDFETNVHTTSKVKATTIETTTTTTKTPLSPCERMRQSSLMMGHSSVPNCIDDVYASTQCSGQPGEHACWCSDKFGKRIPGTIMEPPNIPDCDRGENLTPCLYQLVTVMRQELMGVPKPHCTEGGLFHPVQCKGSVCFCVDKDTGISDSSTLVHLPDKPQCGEEETQAGHDSDSAAIEPTDSFEDEDNIIKLGPDNVNPGSVLPDTESTDTDDTYNIDNTPNEDSKDFSDDDDVDYETVDKDGDEDNSDENRIDQVPDEVLKDRLRDKKGTKLETASPIMSQPGLLAGIVGGSVVLALCLVLLIMFIIYRMRKKDEGSYPLDEPRKPPKYPYMRAPEREFYA